MRFAKHLLMSVALLMIFAAANYGQQYNDSTRNSSAKDTSQTSAENSPDKGVTTPQISDDAVILAGCETAAKEVAASRDYIAHLERVKADYENILALEAVRAGIVKEQLEAKRTEAAELREALKAERESYAAMVKEKALLYERISKLEKRGGGLKGKILTVAIGAAIGAVLK